MSRIGKLPISIPKGVTVTVDGHSVTVKGPKGELHRSMHPEIGVAVAGDVCTVSRPSDDPRHKSLHGLSRTLVANIKLPMKRKAEFVARVREIVELGPREAIMTMGDGCVADVLIDGKSCLRRARTEPREPIAKRGSGDAFLAGYVAARYEGRSPENCLAYGVACGAESTQHFGAGTVDRNQVERLLGEVAVHDLEVPAEV